MDVIHDHYNHRYHEEHGFHTRKTFAGTRYRAGLPIGVGGGQGRQGGDPGADRVQALFDDERNGIAVSVLTKTELLRRLWDRPQVQPVGRRCFRQSAALLVGYSPQRGCAVAVAPLHPSGCLRQAVGLWSALAPCGSVKSAAARSSLSQSLLSMGAFEKPRERVG